ncbi:MAG: aminopeptidase P family protein [Ignavibacteriae bacterium]|nr:MAG: aminopeptidase P family protein [Ignavibacteriota bacterium]
MIHQRLKAVRVAMTSLRLQSMLVTELPHVRYLTGFSGSCGLCLLTPTDQFFITDRRYKSQAPQEVRGFKIIIAKQTLFPLLAEKKLVPANSRMGFESQHVSVADMLTLKRLLPLRRFIPAANILEEVTAVKDEKEIELIRIAAGISDRVFQRLLKLVRPGVRECDLAAEISYLHRMYGAEGDAFDPIVASGERGALPHAHASEKKIRKGEMVVLDFGCCYRGYNSDITRTLAVGRPTSEMKKVYGIVLEAQRKAIEGIQSGVAARSIDAIARNHIRRSGYGRYFIHSLGHGLGIHVHDPLRLSALSKAVLEPGNVTTIEPGIYIPGRGGVRIEDDVVVRKSGCEILNTSSKELIIV